MLNIQRDGFCIPTLNVVYLKPAVFSINEKSFGGRYDLFILLIGIDFFFSEFIWFVVYYVKKNKLTFDFIKHINSFSFVDQWLSYSLVFF